MDNVKRLLFLAIGVFLLIFVVFASSGVAYYAYGRIQLPHTVFKETVKIWRDEPETLTSYQYNVEEQASVSRQATINENETTRSEEVSEGETIRVSIRESEIIKTYEERGNSMSFTPEEYRRLEMIFADRDHWQQVAEEQTYELEEVTLDSIPMWKYTIQDRKITRDMLSSLEQNYMTSQDSPSIEITDADAEMQGSLSIIIYINQETRMLHRIDTTAPNMIELEATIRTGQSNGTIVITLDNYKYSAKYEQIELQDGVRVEINPLVEIVDRLGDRV